MSTPSVSVIIPAFNAAQTISTAIKAILNQRDSGLIELIVVDDGSTDSTPELVQSFSQVKYVYQKNAGPAAARNHGAQLAFHEYLFFTDSDCIPEPEWILKMVVPFKNPTVGVVTGSYGIANPKIRLARCVHNEILWRHHRLMPEFPRVFGSYNVCIRKDVFEQCGGYNEGYRTASGEDNDLAYRILKRGYRIYFAKDARVDHFHPQQAKKYLGEQATHGYWRVRMYRDHPGMTTGDDYTFWKDSLELILVYGIMAFLVLGFVSFSDFYLLTGFFILFLFVLELGFSLTFLKNFVDVFYYAIVMFLRSFARTLGFSSGILHFASHFKAKII